MKISKLNKWLGAASIAVALSVSGGLVLAQDGNVNIAVDANGDFDKAKAKAELLLGEMEKGLAHIYEAGVAALKTNNIPIVNCTKRLQALATTALEGAQKAQNNMNLMTDASYLLEIEKGAELMAAYVTEADECIGEGSETIGDESETEVEGGDSDEDPGSDEPVDPGIDIPFPPTPSPFE